jgi:hypothetical protein
MPKYIVEWVINDDRSEDPYNAAQAAWESLHNDGSIANVFVVKDEHDMATVVDLLDGSVEEPVWAPNNRTIADLADWMAGEQWPVDEIVEMIRTPHKYASEYSKMIVERAFDAVAKEPEADDETTEEN